MRGGPIGKQIQNSEKKAYQMVSGRLPLIWFFLFFLSLYWQLGNAHSVRMTSDVWC